MAKDEITLVQELLHHCGMTAFVNYYYEFQKKLTDEEFTKLFQEKEKEWNVTSYKTIVRYGKKIIEKELDELALLIIVKSDKRISDETREKAKLIIKYIEGKRLYEDEKFSDIKMITNEDIYWELKDLEDDRKLIT